MVVSNIYLQLKQCKNKKKLFKITWSYSQIRLPRCYGSQCILLLLWLLLRTNMI